MLWVAWTNNWTIKISIDNAYYHWRFLLKIKIPCLMKGFVTSHVNGFQALLSTVSVFYSFPRLETATVFMLMSFSRGGWIFWCWFAGQRNRSMSANQVIWRKPCFLLGVITDLVLPPGIEPSWTVWQVRILPLSHRSPNSLNYLYTCVKIYLSK